MKKLNIAQLLKYCPKGMELDCTMYDNVKLIDVDEREEIVFPIRVVREDGITELFTEYGQYIDSDFAKCVIYPKGKTTWEGFIPPFKDGDILFVSSAYNWILIYKENEDKKDLYKYVAIVDHPNRSCIYRDDNNPLCCKNDVSEIRLATEEEKERLFKVIKYNGYKWNPQEKTLEKLIESNEDTDDRIVVSGIYFDRENYADEVELHLNNYDIEIRDGKTYAIFKNQETKTLKPKFKVGDRVKNKDGYVRIVTIAKIHEKYYSCVDKDGLYSNIYIDFQDEYELVPIKFDISNLKPFDKVLVRTDNFSPVWRIDFYDSYNPDVSGYFTPFRVTGGESYQQCIPYKGNENLHKTTNECDEFYKNWE